MLENRFFLDVRGTSKSSFDVMCASFRAAKPRYKALGLFILISVAFSPAWFMFFLALLFALAVNVRRSFEDQRKSPLTGITIVLLLLAISSVSFDEQASVGYPEIKPEAKQVSAALAPQVNVSEAAPASESYQEEAGLSASYCNSVLTTANQLVAWRRAGYPIETTRNALRYMYDMNIDAWEFGIRLVDQIYRDPDYTQNLIQGGSLLRLCIKKVRGY